jgi:hypothetical protein
MITDRSVVDRILSKLDTATLRAHRLPQQVFRDGYGDFACIEFDIFSGARFWHLLQGLAANAGDGAVICMALDPDPVEYFFKEFGMYGAIEIDAGGSADQYFAALSSSPETSPADSLLHNSEVLAWCSRSLDWLMWGERSLTVVMLGLRRGFAGSVSSIATDSGVRVFSPDDAIPGLISASFPNDEASPAWTEEFLRNYSKLPAAHVQRSPQTTEL